jgi:hypothetical protein
MVPHIRDDTLWSPVATDLLLIGSKAPLSTDFKKSLARFEDTKVRGELKRLGIKSFSTILSLQVASDEGVRTAVGRGRVNEDLFPVLEYEAPKAFFLGQVSRFLVPYDERRLPRNGSPLFFAQYLEKYPLGRKEKKDITLYHLTYGSLTRLDLARNFVELWLRQAPRDPEAHWALARIEEGLGNLEAALEFQAYLKRRSLVAPRSAEKALSYLHQLLRLENSKRDRIYRDIARIYAADRDYKSAISYLEKAAAYAQNNEGVFQPDTHWLEAAGMALEIGDVETGLVLVRKVLVFDPENNAAKKSLRELSQLTQTGPNRKVLLLEGDAQ